MLLVLSMICTLYSQWGFSPSVSNFIPHLTGVCARVFRKHFLYEESILTALLLKVEILWLLDLFSIMQPDHLGGRITYIQNTSHLQMILSKFGLEKMYGGQWDKIKNNEQRSVEVRHRELRTVSYKPHCTDFVVTSASSCVVEVTCSCKYTVRRLLRCGRYTGSAHHYIITRTKSSAQTYSWGSTKEIPFITTKHSKTHNLLKNKDLGNFVAI